MAVKSQGQGHVPPACFMEENKEPHVTKKKKAMLSMSTPTPTQSSTSSASLTRPQIKKKDCWRWPSIYPSLCPTSCTWNADDDNAASQKSDAPIVLSDSDEEEDWVEVIDDEEELGVCGILFWRSANWLKLRATKQGVGCTYLCVLQANANSPVYWWL